MSAPACEPSEEAKMMLKALERAVARALEKKRRLGQYAVIWQDGKVIKIGGDGHGNDIAFDDTEGQQAHRGRHNHPRP